MKTTPRKAVFSLLTLSVMLFMGWQAGLAAGAPDVSIVVLPFEINAEPELDYLAEDLPEILRDRLAREGFNVASGNATMDIVRYQGIEFIDLSVARDIALLAGSNYAVYGSLSQVGETLSLDVRLVEAFGLKEPQAFFVVKKGLINILPAVDELVQKIVQQVLKKDVVAEIDVQNNRILDKDVVLMRLRMQQGDLYDPKAINEELKRLYALGYFDDVQVRVEDVPAGKRVVFVVEEKPLIQAVQVSGTDAIDQDDVLEVMSVKGGSVLNFELLSQDLDKIRELYRQKGYYRAEVDYELEQTDERQARLNITVEEGNKLYIENIEIQGAEKIDSGKLKKELALSERGLFSFLTKSGILREELLDRDAAALEAYYNNRGFMDARVSQPEVRFEEEGISITFTVVEGERYTIHNVDLKGDLIESPESLFELTSLDDLAEESDYFDRSVMRDDVQALVDYYTDYGYAYADASASIDKNAENRTVGVSYILEKGERVYIGRVTLEGNTKTRDNVIRRELRILDGEQFSGQALRRSQERLRRLDYFETVDLETIPTAEPNEMDLKVRVKEKPTGMFSVGVGYSTLENAFVTGIVQERNLFGKGYNLSFRGSFGSKTTDYTLQFWNPRLFDSKLGIGIDSYVTDRDYSEYDRETTGGRLRIGYPLGEFTRAFASYRLEDYEISDVDEEASSVIKDAEGENLSSVLGLSVTRDTTNSRIHPTRGTVNTISLEYGGGFLAGDDDFVKGVVESDYYKGLFWDTVFHWSGTAGVVVENGGDEIPVFERFYLGGINSVRGYEGRKISPRDEVTDDRIGGEKMFFTNFEYIFPLSKEFGLMGLTFFDAGSSWEDESDFDVYKSVGVGLRWFSPMGLIRVEYGYPLDNLEGDDGSGKFEFSMGQLF